MKQAFIRIMWVILTFLAALLGVVAILSHYLLWRRAG